MKSVVIEDIIHSILHPEFRCKLGVHPRRKEPFAFIDFTTKRLTKKIKGGKDACLLNIGERLSQLYIKNTSILIFDQFDNIVCNHNFTVNVFKTPLHPSQPNFISDISFHFYKDKQSPKFFYSIWLKHIDKKVTGFAQTEENGPQLAQLNLKDKYWICVNLIKILHLNLGKKLVPNMQIRIHEVDFDNGIWNIYND